jgi:molybdopterin converting factor small subunit
MTVTVHYFAMLREQARRDSETRVTNAGTPRELYTELGFTLPAGNLRVAINDAFVAMDARLNDGDEVTFIPPVAGG